MEIVLCTCIHCHSGTAYVCIRTSSTSCACCVTVYIAIFTEHQLNRTHMLHAWLYAYGHAPAVEVPIGIFICTLATYILFWCLSNAWTKSITVILWLSLQLPNLHCTGTMHVLQLWCIVYVSCTQKRAWLSALPGPAWPPAMHTVHCEEYVTHIIVYSVHTVISIFSAYSIASLKITNTSIEACLWRASLLWRLGNGV